MPSVNKDNFAFSFPIWMPLVSFSCLIALARTSSTMHRSDKRKHHSFVPDLRGRAFNLFLIKYDVICELSYKAFVMLR